MIRLSAMTAALLWRMAAGLEAQECESGVLTGLRASGESYLVATALADTVPAGRVGPITLHGQRVRLERMTGSTRVPAGSAVLVPWASGDRCQPTSWRTPARWLRPGSRGLFVAVLRPRSSWVSGQPTFDVYGADRQPYPAVEAMDWADRSEPLLGIEALADFLALLPTSAADSANPEAERRPLWRWARAHPHLASREPARYFLGLLCDDLLGRRARASRSPLAGTYRFRIELSGEPTREIYIRTSPNPTQVVNPLGPRGELYCAGKQPPAYTWFVIAGTSRDQLAGTQSGYPSSFTIASSATSTGEGVQVWPAEIDPAVVPTVFRQLAPYRAFYAALMRQEPASDSPRGGRFVAGRDGHVRFEQTIRVGGRTLTLAGARVSPEVVPPPPLPSRL